MKSLSQDTLDKLEKLVAYTDQSESSFNLYCDRLEDAPLVFAILVFFCAFWEGFWNQIFILLKESQKDLEELNPSTSLKIGDWLVDIYRQVYQDSKNPDKVICFSQWLQGDIAPSTLCRSTKLLYKDQEHPLTARKVICFKKISIDWSNIDSLYKARNAYVHRLDEPAMLKGIEAIEKVQKGFKASREIYTHLRVLFQIDID